MTRKFNSSAIEVLTSIEVNKNLPQLGRVVVQIEPGTVNGFFIVEHMDRETLLKGEDGNGLIERGH